MSAAYDLRTTIWVPLARPAVFDFFADAHNLERITPEFLRFRVLTPAPIPMAAGTLIDYRIGLHGIPVTWKTEITAWQPPDRFVDTQRRGPYRTWIHTHTFEEQDGGTAIHDHVHYVVPGGPLAPLANRLFVAPDVQRIFEYRQLAMEQALDVVGRARRGPVRITPAP